MMVMQQVELPAAQEPQLALLLMRQPQLVLVLAQLRQVAVGQSLQQHLARQSQLTVVKLLQLARVQQLLQQRVNRYCVL